MDAFLFTSMTGGLTTSQAFVEENKEFLYDVKTPVSFNGESYTLVIAKNLSQEYADFLRSRSIPFMRVSQSQISGKAN